MGPENGGPELTCSISSTRRNSNTFQPFLQRPFLAPLVFPNESSDARDHCANERTFLSWLRLSMYLAVVSVAIVISFHLKTKPSELELRMALPLGCIFWVLSLACLASGMANYVRTVTRYSRRAALVQSGWKTQLVRITDARTATFANARSQGIHRRQHCYCCILHFVLVRRSEGQMITLKHGR